MFDITNYNGAAYGYSPFDMSDYECRNCYESRCSEEDERIDCWHCGREPEGDEDFILNEDDHYICGECYKEYYEEVK